MLSKTAHSFVQLVEYTHTYDEQLSNYHFSKEQLQFTSLLLDKINNPNVSNTTKHILILENRIMVGYFALRWRKAV
ncbi:hypothetical protein [Shouchella lehensis]|uniref:GNAT family N-acetyltransferase n=1 Tax=Shouchella lehensis TaxID=300825 RepID=A0A4Y7WM62_9BACI|nr:hypothetical protein [Shouchella lehensis]TES49481.1 hypothetical protein E2L03_08405 [Shouchella lehensis]